MNIGSIIGRRQFLKSATIFGGLAALLGIVRPAPAGPKAPQRQPEDSSQGYRLTEHIKKYYETARL
ncbi:MAG: twin-arginine translocation signal domain-containing protein [Thermodesulfobacteriota bacterium]